MQSLEEIKNNPAFQQWWYYSIELYPELFTPGQYFENIALVRNLLRGIDVAGKRCIDIGSMECLVPLLLQRRGARCALAYDRVDMGSKVRLAEQCLGVSIPYLSGFDIGELRLRLRDAGSPPFDLVVFSGVLYHMLDPLHGLACARGLLRNGGLMVIETAVLNENALSQSFNANGRYYRDPTMANFWFPSLSLLEYLCRFLRLNPLDFAYFPHGSDATGQHELGRCALVCRAEERAIALADDPWMMEQDRHEQEAFHGVVRNYEGMLDWRELANEDVPMEYCPQAPVRIFYPETEVLDLYGSVNAAAPSPRPPEALVLRLCDLY